MALPPTKKQPSVEAAKPKGPGRQKQLQRELRDWEDWIDGHIAASDPETDVNIEPSRMPLSDEAFVLLRKMYRVLGWGRVVNGGMRVLTKGYGMFLYHPDGDKP